MPTLKLPQDFSSPYVYRDDNIRAGVTNLANGGVHLYGWNLINPNTYAVYVKFTDTLSGGTTIGTTAVEKTLLIPGMSQVFHGNPIRAGAPMAWFSTGFNMYVTTALADSDTAVPLLSILTEIYYR